jgi:hypothetical protein
MSEIWSDHAAVYLNGGEHRLKTPAQTRGMKNVMLKFTIENW